MFKRLFYGLMIGFILTMPLHVNADPLTVLGSGTNRNTVIFNVDPNGDVTTDDTSATIGTSAKPYPNGYFTDLNIADDVAITSDLTVSGTITVDTSTEAFKFGEASLDTASAPSAAGILAVDSSYDLYIATGTGAGAWVLIGGQ